MGRKTRGIHPETETGTWQVDKRWRGTRLRQRGFPNFDDAERWLVAQLAALREVEVHGQRGRRTFEDVASHYATLHEDKVSLETELYLLKGIMPYIGALELTQIHDGTLAPYVQARLEEGRAHKTINLALGVVRHILNLAAQSWRDENGLTWLLQAPKLTMLPLVGHQRDPRPITWKEQRLLLPALPAHLARMALFALNTGVREKVICSLRWEWEVKVPQLGVSVFVVPRQNVKGRKRERIIVCNSVAQSVVESMRGKHAECVFVWRRERVKSHDPAKMGYRPIATMNNTGWQTARKAVGLADVHVHDLRHTVGMRLREAGVQAETISDILWHSSPTMTHHYSVAQIAELHGALERITTEPDGWNRSLSSLRAEQGIHPKLTQERKTG